MISYIKEIIVPYVKRVRDTLDDHNQAALAIFDRFKGQLTDSILELLETHNIQSVVVPVSCTDRLQPMDISVNKAAKSFLKSQFQTWYSEQVSERLTDAGGDIDKIESVDMTTARMKCVSAQWIVRLYDHLCLSPDVIANGFLAIARSINAGQPDWNSDSMANSDSNEDDDEDDSDNGTAYFSSDEES